jgi:hypothetical protein
MKRYLLLFFAAALLAPQAISQEKAAANEPEKVYKLVFALSELQNGNKINSRQYTVIQSARSEANVRVGNRVPVVTNSTGQDPHVPPVQWQYIDVGFKLENVLMREDAGKLYMHLSVDLSGTLTPEESPDTARVAPVIRSMRQEFQPAVPLDKTTVVALIDDVNSKRTFQLEVTATPLK